MERRQRDLCRGTERVQHHTEITSPSLTPASPSIAGPSMRALIQHQSGAFGTDSLKPLSSKAEGGGFGTGLIGRDHIMRVEIEGGGVDVVGVNEKYGCTVR